MKKILLLLAICLLPSLALALEGKIVHVTDGDTVTILTPEKREVKVRLYGIDAPEKSQAFGSKSADALRALAALKEATVLEMDVDRYGRIVGIVTTEDGVNLNERQVGEGNAWVYLQYCKSPVCNKWEALEERAKREHWGLWADAKPTPPWEFRHGDKGEPKGKTDVIQEAPKAVAGALSGNTQSHVFHAPGCRHYDCKNCVQHFATREAAIKAGYRPCGICRP